MQDYAPTAMELAPRDIVARAIQTEVDLGRGFENQYVYLDLRHLGKEKLVKRLPSIREICINFGGFDPDGCAHPHPTGPALLHGRDRCGPKLCVSCSRVLCSRRMRLCQRARRQPAGGKFSVGYSGLRKDRWHDPLPDLPSRKPVTTE